ncbi:MAG: DUF1697 domain-containing protein [Bacteroidales bacterium]|nr:DUF1697 domain-containing protein [Bacteroidales bacterium]
MEVLSYIAFLRGINVGGHHKVPMVDLRREFEKLNHKNIVTLLNSGNIVFDAINSDIEELEKKISSHLEKFFGFPIPTIIRTAEMIHRLLDNSPFHDVGLTKDIRLYVSFLRENNQVSLKLPWNSPDNSLKIIGITNKTVLSVVDLSVSETTKAMALLERYFGKDITTRNWNTIERIGKIVSNP